MSELRDKAPKVTVCLPTYNRAALLTETLQSILSQSFRDFEVIVGDNCSTDSTADVMATVRDSRVRSVFNEVNIGHYRNMNQLLDLAGRALVAQGQLGASLIESFAASSDLVEQHQKIERLLLRLRLQA